MATANASTLDEAIAAAEAVALMRRTKRSAADDAVLLVDGDTFPQTLAVVHTRAKATGIPVLAHDFGAGLPDVDFFGVLLQYPGDSGLIRDIAPGRRLAAVWRAPPAAQSIALAWEHPHTRE